MQQDNRRTRRTRKLLNNALVELISEKEYAEITIHEITERADLGHRTFYHHFPSKDDLLIDVIETVLSDFRDLLVFPAASFFGEDEQENTQQENARKLFEYVDEQEALFRVIFQEGPDIYQSVLHIARKSATDVLHSIMDETDIPIPSKIMANHATTSSIELLKWWLEEGKPYSTEEMGEYFVLLVFKPMRDLLTRRHSSN